MIKISRYFGSCRRICGRSILYVKFRYNEHNLQMHILDTTMSELLLPSLKNVFTFNHEQKRRIVFLMDFGSRATVVAKAAGSLTSSLTL